MFGIVSSWVGIIFVILLLQYKLHNKIKQNYLSQAEEIIQLRKIKLDLLIYPSNKNCFILYLQE